MVMRQVSVCDVPFNLVKGNERTYDWLILAIGAESRCCHVATQLFNGGRCTATQILVLRYPDVNKCEAGRVLRRLTDLCGNKQRITEVVLESDSHEEIYNMLNSMFRIDRKTDCSIIVDYSCMSRVWYSALLYWFYLRYEDCNHLSFYFLYAKGKYTEAMASKDVTIREIRPVPGCGGAISRQANTVAIFCLGFYGYMSLCVYDELEPNEIYTILTSEKPLRKYPIERQPGNKELMERAANVIKVSVRSVEGAFRRMMDIAKYRQLKGDNVTIVPMGPKPHILASILVALANHDVCVMRVRHDEYTSNVAPAGEIVATGIRFVDINYESD